MLILSSQTTPSLSWSLDPVISAVVAATALVYIRGVRRLPNSQTARPRNQVCFFIGLLTVFVALVSPLELMSRSLASAHMVQHQLLIAVGAPLLAWSVPGGVLACGSQFGRQLRPSRLRGSATPKWYQQTRLILRRRSSTVIVLAAGLHISSLWFWHAAKAYDATLESTFVHRIEHSSIFAAALAFWIPVTTARLRPERSLRMLLLFAVGILNTFLAVLITFATSPWYQGYALTTDSWGLSHLGDQQLAGAIMWVPGGFVYLFGALGLLSGWLRSSDQSPGFRVRDPRRSRSQRCEEGISEC
jgi:putative membrane protein